MRIVSLINRAGFRRHLVFQGEVKSFRLFLETLFLPFCFPSVLYCITKDIFSSVSCLNWHEPLKNSNLIDWSYMQNCPKLLVEKWRVQRPGYFNSDIYLLIYSRYILLEVNSDNRTRNKTWLRILRKMIRTYRIFIQWQGIS